MVNPSYSTFLESDRIRSTWSDFQTVVIPPLIFSFLIYSAVVFSCFHLHVFQPSFYNLCFSRICPAWTAALMPQLASRMLGPLITWPPSHALVPNAQSSGQLENQETSPFANFELPSSVALWRTCCIRNKKRLNGAGVSWRRKKSYDVDVGDTPTTICSGSSSGVTMRWGNSNVWAWSPPATV